MKNFFNHVIIHFIILSIVKFFITDITIPVIIIYNLGIVSVYILKLWDNFYNKKNNEPEIEYSVSEPFSIGFFNNTIQTSDDYRQVSNSASLTSSNTWTSTNTFNNNPLYVARINESGEIMAMDFTTVDNVNNNFREKEKSNIKVMTFKNGIKKIEEY